MINLALMSYFLRNQLPRRILLGWLAANAVIIGARFLLVFLYRGKSAHSGEGSWLTWFRVAIFLAGAAFGSIGLFGLSYPALPYKIFIYFVLGGMAASTVGAYSADCLSAYLYGIPIFFPVTVRFLLMEPTVYTSMGIMGIAFYTMMIVTLHRIHGQSIWALRLAEENKRLGREWRKQFIQQKALYDMSPYGILIESPEGEIIDCNAKAEEMTGYGKEELRAIGVEGILPPDSSRNIAEYMRDEVSLKDGFFESYNVKKSGELFPVEIAVQALNVEDEELVLVVVRDITERKQAEQKIRILSWTVEQSPASVIITDTKGAIEYVNRKYTETTGYAAEEVKGTVPRLLSSKRKDEEAYGNLWAMIRSGREWHGEFRNFNKEGKEYWESVSIAPILDNDGAVVNYVAVKEDITEKKRREKNIEHQALYDPLTDLPNRRFLVETLAGKLHRAEETGETVTILYMDLDGFKPINDRYGHDYGDEVLKVTAQRILSNLRHTDVAARFGGDEFVVVADTIPDRRIISNLARRIVAAVEKPVHINGSEIRIGISVGISIYPHNGDSIELLLSSADTAMYRAKSSTDESFVYA